MATTKTIVRYHAVRLVSKVVREALRDHPPGLEQEIIRGVHRVLMQEKTDDSQGNQARGAALR
jgi:hypothetical protein